MRTPATHRNARRRGFSLVELMVALTLGLVVTSAILAIYLNTTRGHARNERYAWMQENARYALKALADDFSMVDFWGKVISTDIITTTLTPPAGDCAIDINIYDGGDALMLNNYHVSPALTHFTPCATITTNQKANTDILVLKRVEGSPTASTFIDVADADGDSDTSETLTTGASDLENGTVYLRSNDTTASFINDAAPGNPPALGQSDWSYIPRVYFVRNYYESVGDGIPALCRLEIVGVGLGNTQCIAEGVEDLHVQFGIDSNDDGAPNLYTAGATVAQMEKAVSARIYLLMRSIETDHGYTNGNIYNLGDVVIPAFNDGYHRVVYSTTVALRNSVSRNLMR